MNVLPITIRIWINGLSQLAPQLRALDELAAHGGHMTRAADALGIPQSSMSRRIHALEKALGVRLIIQEGRTVRLTPAALKLADQTRRPLRELEATIESIAGEADPEHGMVRFGFPLTMGAGVVPGLDHRIPPACTGNPAADQAGPRQRIGCGPESR